MLLGITGQIGSGKSSVAAVFAHLGTYVIDADRIGRNVVERDPKLQKRLVRAFGPEILRGGKSLDRKRLAALAFASPAAKKRLDELVHPYLLRELRQETKRSLKAGLVVVIDAALLLDWGMDKEVDRVILVHASRRLRMARLVARGIALADARAREQAQLPYETYLQRSHHVIFNSGTKAELRRKATRLWHRLISQSR
ncbi:MAG: dephospho-CoA kinase [Candidatus Zixiibacteriota bacterium]